MTMCWIWIIFLSCSILSAVLTGRMQALSAAVLQGAQSAVTLSVSIGGALCLWSGVGRLAERSGAMDKIARLLHPLLRRLFPQTETDPILRRSLSANLCANLLGLGNAATPMGIQAARRLVSPTDPKTATDGLCRLIVLNTASITLIPSSVAAIRVSLGCSTPFDILPAVWVSSLCSVSAGLFCACQFARVQHHG